MQKTMSLSEVFQTISDHRSPSGRRHPLSAILTLMAVSVLAGANGYEAIARFGRNRGPEFAKALGFTKTKTPCKSTLFYVFKNIDREAVEKAIRSWMISLLPQNDVLNLDGKTICSSAHGDIPGVHLLNLYSQKIQGVVAQISVGRKTNEHKAALQLIGLIPITDKTITGDAMFCQRDLSEEIIDRDGDYLWQVKDNQPTLKQDIADVFDENAKRSFSPFTTKEISSRSADC